MGIVALFVIVALTVYKLSPYLIKSNTIPSTELSGLRSLPKGFKCHGIDISHYQEKIDWEIFKNKADSTIRFVYCKATEGIDYIDPLWKRNRKNLEELEIRNGAYHFFSPSQSAATQANHFLSNYTSKQNDLPPVLDSETEVKDYPSLIRAMKEWLKIVEDRTGKRPIIYTSYHLYKTQFYNSFSGYKFWVANYNNVPNKFLPVNIIHWQYSDKGRIPGIRGDVDLNVSKINF